MTSLGDPSLGGVGAALDPPPALAELAVRTASLLQLDVAGVDILFDENRYWICEANSAPGFEGLEKACGISVPDEIFNAVRARLGLSSSRDSRWRQFLSGLRDARTKLRRAGLERPPVRASS